MKTSASLGSFGSLGSLVIKLCLGVALALLILGCSGGEREQSRGGYSGENGRESRGESREKAVSSLHSASTRSSPIHATSTQPQQSAQLRIITLAPHLTEWIYALGAEDQLIATVEHADYPPAAQALPRVGNAFTLNLEQIVAMRPDLIFYWEDGGELLQFNKLRSLGVRLVPIKITHLDDLPLVAEKICNLVECSQGERLIEELTQRVYQLQTAYRNLPKQRALLQIAEKPLWVLGGKHLLSDALRSCGVVNVFENLTSTAAMVHYEETIAAEPDLIIVNQHLSERERKQKCLHPSHQGRQSHLRTIWLDPDQSLRPTPRLIEVVEYVCKTLAGESREGREEAEEL